MQRQLGPRRRGRRIGSGGRISSGGLAGSSGRISSSGLSGGGSLCCQFHRIDDVFHIVDVIDSFLEQSCTLRRIQTFSVWCGEGDARLAAGSSRELLGELIQHFCDSVPSIFISELDWMPLTPSRAPITPSTTIHAAMKYQGLE